MVCAYCGSETRVINSRHQKRTNSVWRRRTCPNCGRIFTTTEQIDYEKSWTVAYQDAKLPPGQKPPKPQPFLRDKLLMSIHASLGHRGTSALPDALALTKTIIGNLGKMVSPEGNLSSVAIATITHDTLQRFDNPAATMFQAYHADVL